ncbi:hypothetical protein [Sphingosinicella sp.]|uniref:hypothetical protein n=1 Tax=Sphingosinicella sp. TaxID=1917971 RepID=UPI0040384F2D
MLLNGVPEAYRHYSKRAVPRGVLESGGAIIKLYHLEKAGEPVPPPLAEAACAWLDAQAGSVFVAGDLGFVILHRCGADFHFLLPVFWRGANEAWETVAYHHGDMTGFERFDPAYPVMAGREIAPRPTFCVWELAIVAHEALAWSRFLAGDRDEAALAIWRADTLEAEV